MTIYEIDEQILACIDTETGEVIDIDRLNELQMERKQKISNVARWYKDLKAEAEAIKAEKQNLTHRQQVCENKMESLKNYLEYALQGEKFKDGAVSISYRPSKSVDFVEGFDYSTLPAEFQKVTIEPKKTEIKKAIESGVEIPGAFIEEKVSTIIK